MRVRFAAAARKDLRKIADYIGADSPNRALSFVDEMQDACLALTDAPLRFGFLEGFEAAGLRRRPFGSYLIIYSVDGETLLVRRVLHAAQDYAKVLSGLF
jgi:toxin ParE1/3/4